MSKGDGAAVLLPFYITIFVYVSYGLLIIMGHIHDTIDRVLGRKSFERIKGYAPLTSDFESFFTRRLFGRVSDCWNRPTAGVPGAWIDVLERKSNDPTWNTSFSMTGKKLTSLNLASYNYLGFASNKGEQLETVVKSVHQYGISMTSPRMSVGGSSLHKEAEERIAKFLGKESAMIFGMGYNTNSTTIPALCGKGDLIISDSLNHASLVAGCRTSGATVRVFKHNNFQDLEKIVRNAIIEGQPLINRPWKKILIVVEGIYSMEGEICNLPEILKIKKKYKCYLYVDEAHSIGALGENARGVCDHFNIDTSEVDILMGTFTKSFASVGGYVASSKTIIDYLKTESYGQIYETSMSPGTLQQVISSFKVLTGEDGTDIGKKKVKQLKENSNYFRNVLKSKGLQVFGDEDSPVIPMMLYFPSKTSAFSRECLKKNIAVVVVGFPATPLLLSRVRFCVSASHTIEDLKWAADEIEKISDKLLLKYGKYDESKENELVVM